MDGLNENRLELCKCGGKAETYPDEDYHGFYVHCTKCGFQLDAWFDGYYEGSLPAIRAWNEYVKEKNEK